MTTQSRGQHGYGAAGKPPDIPETSYAEQARTLMYLGRVGTLSTESQKQPGFPFGSVMPYGADAQGRPVFLVSTMAMHTQNLEADPSAALLVMQDPGAEDVLGAGRVTVLGKTERVPGDERAAVRELYLAAYPNAKYWVDFDDFSFYRMDVVDLYFVGGFGVMGWVTADDYRTAQPDPLADAAKDIISHMNADHSDSMILLAKAHAGLEATEAQMTAVDRLGFQVRLKTEKGMKGARIAFDREVRSALETREVLVEMVKHAKLQSAEGK